MKPLSKEEIIADALMRIKATDGTNEIGEYMSGAMDSWADQQSRIAAIGFAEFTEKRWMYDDESKTWTTFSKGDSPLTTEELYNLFIQDQPAIQ